MTRRTFVTGVGASMVAPGCARPAEPARSRDVPAPVFWAFQRQLAHAHSELRALAEALLGAIRDPATATDAIADAIAVFCQQLLAHHKAEDMFFFPAFRAARRLRSSDVAFLEARDLEHLDLHRLCLELRETGRKPRARPLWRASLDSTVVELRALSLPHFELEERALTASHVATLLDAGELTAVYADMQRNWNQR